MCIFSLLLVCGCGLCRLVCSVNMLYMELSYTGSLDRSTSLYLLCSSFIYFVHPLFTLFILYLLCSSFIYFVHPLFTFFILYLLCSSFIYFVHPLFTLFILYLLCSSFIYFVHPLFTLFILYLLCSSFIYFVHPLFLCSSFIYFVHPLFTLFILASEHVTVQISLPIDLLEWEHVTVQISYACKTTAGFINCFPLINFVFDVYLTWIALECVYSLHCGCGLCW